MESDYGADGGGRAGQVQRVLAGLDADRAELSRAMAVPWWARLEVAGVGATLVVLIAVAPGLVPPVVLMVASLLWWRQRRRGVRLRRHPGPRSRWLCVLLLVLAVLSVGAAFVVGQTDLSQWWAVPLGALTFTWTVLLAPRYWGQVGAELAAGWAGGRR